MNALKDFFMEPLLWWIEWLAGGEAYDLVFRILGSIAFVACIVLSILIWIYKL